MNNDKCILIGNKFANILQIVVFLNTVFILLFHKIIIENNYKNYYQKYIKILNNKCNYKKSIFYIKRTWKIWFMDNTKQGLSSMLGHIWATYISIYISDNNEFECNWFLVQFLIDTLFAMYLSFTFSKISIYLIGICNKDIQNKYMTIGYYEDNNYKIWIIQTIHWILVSMLSRIICSLLIILTKNIWIEPNIWMNNMWNNKRQEQLFFTILIMPIILNSIQYLTQNWFLRWISDRTQLHEPLIIHEIV
jgi:hypothetical protein